MAWYNIGAILLAIVCAVPLLLLLCVIIWFIYMLVSDHFRKPEATFTRQTALGEFVKIGVDGDWTLWVEKGEDEIQVCADDVEGQPEPAFLARVPQIFAELPRWEAVARQAVPKLSEAHKLGTISRSCGDNIDFTLGLDYEEEAWGETVFVDFHNSEVVACTAVD